MIMEANIFKVTKNKKNENIDAQQKSYLAQIVSTMLQQIEAGVGQNVMMSWGMEQVFASLYASYKKSSHTTQVLLPCLRFHVNGFIHQGWVLVAYDASNDLYAILLIAENMKDIKKKITGVFADVLGTTIDSVVERDPSLSDEDYKKQVQASLLSV